MKVLLLLRDPVKRAFSNHMHEVIKGHIPPCPFEEGLANNPAYIEQGLYASHLARWYESFPREQVLVMFAEEISADPAAAARRVFAFAGVAADFQSPILHERRNESDRARFAALRTSLRAGGDWMRDHGMESTLARIKSTNAVSALLKANSIEIRDEIPPMTPEAATRLAAIFRPEMDRLRQMVGCDVLPWETSAALGAPQ